MQTEEHVGTALLERIVMEAPQVADDIVTAARQNDGAEELRNLLGGLKVAGDRIPEIGDPAQLREVAKAMATMSMSLSFHVQTIKLPEVQRALATVVKIIGQYSALAQQCADQFGPPPEPDPPPVDSAAKAVEQTPPAAKEPAAEKRSPEVPEIDAIANIPPPAADSSSSPALQPVAPPVEPKPRPPTDVFAHKSAGTATVHSLQARMSKGSIAETKPRAPTGVFQAYRPPDAPPPPAPGLQPHDELEELTPESENGWSIGTPSETGFFGGMSLRLRDKMARDYPAFSGADDLVDFAAKAGRAEIKRVVDLKTEPMEAHVKEQDLVHERLVNVLGMLQVGAVVLGSEEKVAMVIKGDLVPMFVKGKPIPKALADGLRSVSGESVIDFEGVRIFDVHRDETDRVVAFLFMPLDDDQDDHDA